VRRLAPFALLAFAACAAPPHPEPELRMSTPAMAEYCWNGDPQAVASAAQRHCAVSGRDAVLASRGRGPQCLWYGYDDVYRYAFNCTLRQ
jgi:hypothetical protein